MTSDAASTVSFNLLSPFHTFVVSGCDGFTILAQVITFFNSGKLAAPSPFTTAVDSMQMQRQCRVAVPPAIFSDPLPGVHSAVRLR